MRLLITMPVLDDWTSAASLCASIDDVLQNLSAVSASVLIIDDGSATSYEAAFEGFRPAALTSTHILRLRRNVGHQRAIAISLAYIQQKLTCDAVLVMDADGEDRPDDIPALIQKAAESTSPVTVFARRGRRIESLSFKLFYQIYRLLHYLFTGKGIKVGNFSLLPRQHLESIVSYPELWNHYAATVINSRLPWTTIRADRGRRLHGKSQMNFVGLVVHGVSALFSYQAIVSTRILIGSACLSVILMALILGVLIVRGFTSLAAPNWSTLVIGIFTILIVQFLSTALILVFSGMISRSNLEFLPLRDYAYFVSGCRTLQVTKP